MSSQTVSTPPYSLPRDMSQARMRLGLTPTAATHCSSGDGTSQGGATSFSRRPRRAGYKLLIAGASGAPEARHLGVLGPEELADAYSASDCVVFPSRYEACSLVVLEALACGRPLLTTRVGWMKTFLQAVPAYETLCVEPTLEDVRGRLLALPDLDVTELASQARDFVLAHNGSRALRRALAQAARDPVTLEELR